MLSNQEIHLHHLRLKLEQVHESTHTCFQPEVWDCSELARFQQVLEVQPSASTRVKTHWTCPVAIRSRKRLEKRYKRSTIKTVSTPVNFQGKSLAAFNFRPFNFSNPCHHSVLHSLRHSYIPQTKSNLHLACLHALLDLGNYPACWNV